jgi:hypothetical protein
MASKHIRYKTTTNGLLGGKPARIEIICRLFLRCLLMWFGIHIYDCTSSTSSFGCPGSLSHTATVFFTILLLQCVPNIGYLTKTSKTATDWAAAILLLESAFGGKSIEHIESAAAKVTMANEHASLASADAYLPDNHL